MSGQNVGYIRVSTLDQNTARQLADVALDIRFEEKASGRDAKRPQLEAMCKHVRRGDVLHVHAMDRLARNVSDLRKIIDDLTSRGVQVRFHKENLTFTGEDSPMANLLLSMLGAVAQFERELIRERQAEGIALAKKAGVYKGRKPSLSTQMVSELKERIGRGERKAVLAREYGVSRETLYAHLRAA